MIAVVGGAGEIGAWLVRCLVRHGEAVRVIVRGAPSPDIARFSLDVRHADLRDPGAIERALDGVRVVVNCAIDKTDHGHAARSVRSNVVACDHLLRACARTGVARLVHLSSIVVLPPRVTPEVTARPLEHSRERDWYTRAKIATERRVLAAGDGLDVCVIRPGIVYGPSMAWSRVAFARAERERVALPDPALEGARCYAVYAGDLARLIHRCATTRDALPRILYGISPEAVSWRAFYAEHARAAGLRDPVEVYALATLRRQATRRRPPLAPRVLRWIGASPLLDPVRSTPVVRRLRAVAKAYVAAGPPPPPGRRIAWPSRVELEMYRSHADVPAAQAGAEVGFTYRVPFVEGCRAAADWRSARWGALTADESAAVAMLLRASPTS